MILLMTLNSGTNVIPPVVIAKNILIIGDSTLAAHACRTQSIADIIFNSSELSQGYTASSIAYPGDKIQDQQTKWNNLTTKTNYDIIFIQVGLNNCSPSYTTAQNITALQSLVDSVKNGKKTTGKIVISCMIPARQRFVDLGWTEGYQKWLDLNNAMMTGITNVDFRNDLHVATMNDGNGNLKSIYDCGDHIHENNDGANIIKNAFRTYIF